MDRELAPEITRQKRTKSIVIVTLGIVSVAAVLALFRTYLSTSVEASKIRTAVAQVGPVENTINATGEVIPAFEQVIVSPIQASVQRVLITPGTRVRPGQPILELDKSFSLIELERLKDKLALKRNGIEQLRLRLNKEFYDADIKDKIKSLNINRLRANVEDTRRLQKAGGSTQEDVTKAENELRIAELEKKQLENDLAYSRQSMGASLKESELQAQIEAKNLQELEQKLRQADILADRPGVLTWVNDRIGAAVSTGDMLAKLADLGSFRIDGSCSDMYADQVKVGLPVIVKINETNLRGTITQVKPSVQNNVVQFAIQLDDNRHTSLRPNMKVEVFIVTNRVGKAVRVANGPAFKGKRRQYVYVLTKGVAERRDAEIGLTNFDWVELKSGVQPGEQVIITDLSQYEHSETITITPTDQ
ncbi:HlyD family efflux transporter periplasmic adaptor subunit [Fibrisoma montanum]|uniref:HlyD family efflux transporter periplasmic adaptor subunit n=1 Tax=Fibrisoma montanum TaxID=2305895 RepID=A0A418M2F1_9BACT|nr:HlyD family efflux transporter periplasmic adaptor subunit [Fibrisoma montanum]RIV19868.1 HlyD family efflux transporter periplasmic adaptor subunit [Fibrisoma montanum]